MSRPDPELSITTTKVTESTELTAPSAYSLISHQQLSTRIGYVATFGFQCQIAHFRLRAVSRVSNASCRRKPP